MKILSSLNLVCLACIVAINAAFVVHSRQGSEGAIVRLLPIVSSNLFFLAMFLTLRSALTRVRSRYQHLERRYQSLQMITEDREVEERILETLSDVSVEFLEKMELEPLLERVSQAIHEILRVDISVIEVFVESGGEAMRFLRGRDELTFGDEFYREIVDGGKSLLVNKLSGDKRYDSLTAQGIEAIIVAPLQLHGRTIGLMAAAEGSDSIGGRRRFTSRDLRQLHTFACHAALLIETTQLLRSVRRLSLKDESGDLRDLKERLGHERELQEREMEVARNIQMGLLPRVIPRIGNLVLEGESLPAKDVGGDYYDVLDLGGGKWGIAIADVSGKGVPAALVMVMTRTLLHAAARTSASPANVLGIINAHLYQETDPSVFVSMLYGIWDSGACTFAYANAGHEPPILIRGNAVMSLPNAGVALGAMEHVAGIIEDRTLKLTDDDRLFLFTDGATEAKNERGEMLGSERLLDAFKAATAGNKSHHSAAVLDAIRSFAGNAQQHDDITLVCLNVTREVELIT
ncbi:MAG TPA: GAF domain-containing SpoIIE family protein phosphatase [Planctomycetota bacterium]|nr:GAF domain-containing SpoIIE family protein phosphatase [Planctomycetota bacterium]